MPADLPSNATGIGAIAGDNPDVMVAFALGWQMAELYAEAEGHSDPVAAPPPPPGGVPDTLPGLGRLTSPELLHLRFDQLFAGLSRLSRCVENAGMSVDPIKMLASEAAVRCVPPPEEPAPEPVRGRRGPGHDRREGFPGPEDHDRGPEWREERWSALAPVPQGLAGPPPPPPPTLRRVVSELHVQILDTLTSADPFVGKAYGLGRALADLTLRPAASTRAAFYADFGGQMTMITDSLHDLTSVLPAHAGSAVGKSLGYWQEWVDKQSPDAPVWSEPALRTDPLHPRAVASAVTEALAVQGNRWRSVLAGERKATDFLNDGDYIKAGEALMQRVGALGKSFWRQYWMFILVALIVLAGIVTVLLIFPAGISRGLGTLGVILAAFGMGWKGVGVTFGKAVGRAEPALWGAELDRAIAASITVLPGTSTVAVSIPRHSGFSSTTPPPTHRIAL